MRVTRGQGMLRCPGAKRATNTSASDHFKMRPVPNNSANGKTFAQNAVVNVAILADALRMIETPSGKKPQATATMRCYRLLLRHSLRFFSGCRVDGTALDVANLRTEIRLRPRSLSPASPGADVTWATLYGVQLGASRFVSPRDRSRSRSNSTEEPDSEFVGRVEEIEFQAEHSRNNLNTRLLAVEQRESTPPAIAGLTVNDVQKATVQRFATVVTDLNVLNNGLYEHGKKHARTNAELGSRVAELEAANESLRAENSKHQSDLAALHLRTAIPQFRLEAPYEVELDPGFTAHVRVTVKSVPVARALMDAWANQKVAGYAKIKMVAMASASGQELARNGVAQPQLVPRGDVIPGNHRHHSRPSTSNHARSSEPGRR
ncbi:hypothetical protein B0H13DRAFT_1880312 [Mycena leptocephala]|nr:hypothetical protein B0H13DRAFT_1880312 [Mycena leptocephala]